MEIIEIMVNDPGKDPRNLIQNNDPSNLATSRTATALAITTTSNTLRDHPEPDKPPYRRCFEVERKPHPRSGNSEKVTVRLGSLGRGNQKVRIVEVGGDRLQESQLQ